jgi:hypothetical protein
MSKKPITPEMRARMAAIPVVAPEELRALTAGVPDSRTPWQIDRDNAERTGVWPESWGPFHRHFANDAVHRDGGPECDQPGTPRRVYVFDEDYLHQHETAVAQWAAGQAQKLADALREVVPQDYEEDNPCTADADMLRAVHALLYAEEPRGGRTG